MKCSKELHKKSFNCILNIVLIQKLSKKVKIKINLVTKNIIQNLLLGALIFSFNCVIFFFLILETYR